MCAMALGINGVATNQAHVSPNSSVLIGFYWEYVFSCSNCETHYWVGLSPDPFTGTGPDTTASRQTYCVAAQWMYSPTLATNRGQLYLHITAPSTPGLYYIAIDHAGDWNNTYSGGGCTGNDGTFTHAGFWNGAPTADQRIGAILVY